ncbi:MAG: DUF1553 domain-containing protein, partial [Planctomycetaceae bacterium]|nr:DUF1553 domain-containing protein [Planctomycetaceae bacterium]
RTDSADAELLQELFRPAARHSAETTPRRTPMATWAVLGVSAVAILMLLSRGFRDNHAQTDTTSVAAVTDSEGTATSADSEMMAESSPETPGDAHLSPLPLTGLDHANSLRQQTATAAVPEAAAGPDVTIDVRDDAAVIAEINRLIERAWAENNVRPADLAADSEWLRRAYLTFAGRIPTSREAADFLKAETVRKRSALIAKLESDPQTAEHFAVIWTNLLIGRSNPREVNEDAMFAFLEEQFLNNRPWLETVDRLITANGRSDENGATNFLLAHLNNEATPATAVTARLFLGEQVHCTQCHDHPFAKGVTQDQFWSLNAFFKQVHRRPVLVDTRPMLVAMQDGRQRRVWELTDDDRGGMTFYETRRGQQVAVLPEFAGVTLPEDDGQNRRTAFVRLLEKDPEHRLSQAMVNRMWAHFFGFGFVNPVDDLGAHHTPSHPELFQLLTTAFAESGYDLQRLRKWIALSDAWQLSSRANDQDSTDQPDAGTVPLFTRVYARHMEPEQVYESIRTAMHSVAARSLESSIGTEHRRQWVEQFVDSPGNDDNEESLQFEGSVGQALMMMNGERIETSVELAIDALLTSSATARRHPASAALDEICLSVLSRPATEPEREVFRNRVRSLSRRSPQERASRTALEDMLWAYLNSSEFIAVH